MMARGLRLLAVLAAMTGSIAAATAQEPRVGPSKKRTAGELKAWVKQCDATTAASPKGRGVGASPSSRLCVMRHEQLLINGDRLVAAAVDVDGGSSASSLRISVATGVGIALPAGMKAIVYDRQNWQRARNKQKVDAALLPSQRLTFVQCGSHGCKGEGRASTDFVKALTRGEMLVVLVLGAAGRAISFQVPLFGFGKVFSGRPHDGVLVNWEREENIPKAGEERDYQPLTPASGASQRWSKSCHLTSFNKAGADGKPVIGHDGKTIQEKKRLCLTIQEQRLGGGSVGIEFGVQQIERVKRLGAMFNVPLRTGFKIASGVKLSVYGANEAEALRRRGGKSVKPRVSSTLIFTICRAGGCLAENEATPEMMEVMKSGGIIMARVTGLSGQPVEFAVPLQGFSEAFLGPPANGKNRSVR